MRKTRFCREDTIHHKLYLGIITNSNVIISQMTLYKIESEPLPLFVFLNMFAITLMFKILTCGLFGKKSTLGRYSMVLNNA